MRLRIHHLISLLLVILTLSFPFITASPPDLYCGEHNCYELLNVDASATQQTIKSSYRKLSLKYHPDKNTDPEAVDIFRQIATAYEILSDETSRAAYDDALAHPERYMYNQYQYYRHRYRHNHIAAWKVITTFIAAICIFDYFQRWSRYAYFRTRIADHPVIRTRMRARAKANLEAAKEAAGVKKGKIKITEAEIEAEMAKDDVSNYAEISSRDGRRPSWRDLVLIALPLYLLQNLYWYFRWFILFTILKKPYGWEERSYLTAQKLDIDWNRWIQFPEETRNPIIEQDIWLNARNFAEFKREQMNKNRKGW